MTADEKKAKGKWLNPVESAADRSVPHAKNSGPAPAGDARAMKYVDDGQGALAVGW
jgi:hypothetical protein